MKGWRTILVFVVSGLAYLLAWPQLTEVVDPQWIAIGTAVIGLVLRFITTTPVGNANPN